MPDFLPEYCSICERPAKWIVEKEEPLCGIHFLWLQKTPRPSTQFRPAPVKPASAYKAKVDRRQYWKDYYQRRKLDPAFVELKRDITRKHKQKKRAERDGGTVQETVPTDGMHECSNGKQAGKILQRSLQTDRFKSIPESQTYTGM